MSTKHPSGPTTPAEGVLTGLIMRQCTELALFHEQCHHGGARCDDNRALILALVMKSLDLAPDCIEAVKGHLPDVERSIADVRRMKQAPNN